MTPHETYQRLTGGAPKDFDVHVVASILALSLCEAAASNVPLCQAAGYDGAPPLLMAMFPHASPLFADEGILERGDDERCLLDLLSRGMSTGSVLEVLLAGMLARRCQRPNHLWQDLGLRNRGELSALMTLHFAPLASRNRSDMKWKKFFFRTICRDDDYALCTAPSCGECSDFDNCFSEETGESFLAQLRRQVG